MFKTRLISGIVLVALALFFIISGGYILLVAMTAISLIGMFELYRVFKMEKSGLAIVGYLCAIAFYANLAFPFLPDQLFVFLFYLLFLLAVYVIKYPKFHADQVMAAFFGIFYVAVMLSFIYQTRMLDEKGKYIVWLIFLCSWGADTSAYCVGMLFGKHKMAPVLSPKKSVEGAIGGIAGAFLLTALYCYIFRLQMNITSVEIWLLALVAAIGAVISMIGDLAASAIKRNYDIKDYGKLIPGHGGILDRFDSVIITAPIVYFFSSLFLGLLA